MIEFKEIIKTFDGGNKEIHALNDLTMSIQKNEVFGIIGESGAGKSTLLRLINALETPETGVVKVDGINVHTLSKKQLRNYKKKMGMIFQQFNLLGNKTVKENILLPLELHAYEKALDINEVLKFVGLTEQRNQFPKELSGGEKQRVGIARALITRPQILLCDEPTSALDENTKQEIVALLQKAAKNFSMTILIVSHELNIVKQLCNKVAILEAGNLVEILSINKRKEEKDLNIPYSELAREVLLDD